MRLKIIIPLGLFVGLVLLLVGWFRPAPGPVVDFPVIPPLPLSANVLPGAGTLAVKLAEPRFLSVAPAAINASDAAVNPDSQDVADRVAGLQILAMNNDADSLDQIIACLSDSDPQIRNAALEATIQFRSPAAIPALEALQAGTEPPQEKLGLQQAIDFLKLPPLAQSNPARP